MEGKEVEAAGRDESPVKGEKKQDKGSVEKEAREAFLLQIQAFGASLNADGRSQERRGNSSHSGEAGQWRWVGEGPEPWTAVLAGRGTRVGCRKSVCRWFFFPIPLKVVPIMGISRRVHSNM